MDEQITEEEWLRFLISEADTPFEGWNFSYITANGRMMDGPLTWSYASKLLMSLRRAQSLLDMGTGGGEFLSSLQPLPAHTCATEGYAPNIPIARQRLEPQGVKVYAFEKEGDPLPFADNEFDLVINRHEYYDPGEVLRVLKPEGRFITQQVGGTHGTNLRTILGGQEEYPYTHWTLARAVDELEQAGWSIVEQKEDFPIIRFFDVGAIVYYLKAIPWEVPNFSVEQYFERLQVLHTMIQANGFFDMRTHYFLIVAEKG
jgi:SAM-dependent methyltransferase